MTITFITGGSTGLGYETARRLKELGHKVYIGARDEEKTRKAAESLDIEYVVIDVTDESSVDKAAREIQKREGHIDVLINNAGIPGIRTEPKEITEEIIKQVYDVNVFGIVRVTHAFLPLLEKSENPVIVNVSSGMGSFGKVLNPETLESKAISPVYCSSKSAVCMLTLQYAKGLPEIHINAVDPGPTKTGDQFSRGIQTVTEGTDAIIKMATIDKNGPTGTFTDRQGIVPW